MMPKYKSFLDVLQAVFREHFQIASCWSLDFLKPYMNQPSQCPCSLSHLLSGPGSEEVSLAQPLRDIQHEPLLPLGHPRSASLHRGTRQPLLKHSPPQLHHKFILPDSGNSPFLEACGSSVFLYVLKFTPICNTTNLSSTVSWASMGEFFWYNILLP